ncbi:MAG: RNA-binding protein [Spirochaetales bacterium]|nr:RNA-binding protein [Spirochaetales bacterium]
MSKKIYAGNLPYNTTEDDLQKLFGEFGEIVSVKVISDRNTGKSKGFGFVEMVNTDEASAAISALNGKEMNGRNIKVNEANERPMEKRNFQSNHRGY